MPRAAMFTVFAYDISDDAKRRRVAGMLEERAVRVQNSVFEAWMTQKEAKAMAIKVEAVLATGDSLRVYAIGQAGLARCRTFGAPAIVDAPTFLIA
ncbi:CRISPR-associated endonuclease Cas2 [Pleomorphomonas sp. NRK KF1]|uniref:CRISPR-associated endonuclease Cas2 n=1 Tax=Pleomorphomonas sp. NRK KF1 TaxID=2943000 RepID=UPI00204388C9|nr:CRISPR-associated endonuclease Cas2 [Pleomorphomonas sp. NRK KF1]MCM5552394.1 CRISPR-associated endonuclease Cas2 [Pleomorphomonas sp. NRK KF1]